MIRFNVKHAFAFLCWAASATAQVTVTHSYNGFPVFIATDDADLISIAGIAVPEAIKMTKVTAKVQIQYPEVGDLNIYLYSPDGTRVKLLERNCGALANVDTTFDETAADKYTTFCPAEAGRGPFKANEPLTNFNSADSSIGIWRLAVENNGSDSRTGWIKDYTLSITGTSQATPSFRSATVLNTASVRPGAIAPGQRFSILGLALGPATGVTAPAGALPTTLSGVSVSINGTDVPLSYVSNYRVDAVAPFGIPTTGTVNVQVKNNAMTSAMVPVTAQPTFPGIYTFEQLGIGQVKAANQDGKANSKLAPARVGEVVAFYASGLGAVVPASPAGQVGPTSPLSVVSQPVAASIGGVPAVVAFAGLAPGLAGIYQVNVIVPAGVPAGTRELVISNGGNASQGQATIEVQ
jgi:uncharacterized protein (TIGR03437 family)